MYSFNLSLINGQASAYVFCSLFNPAGSGKTFLLHQVQVTPYAVTTASSAVSTQLVRITAHSGGTLEDVSAVNKMNTSGVNSVAEIRTGNPSVTPGAVIGRFAPPVQATTATSFAPSQQTMSFLSDSWGFFYLAAGEGVAFRQTGAGDTSQRWPFTIAWSE